MAAEVKRLTGHQLGPWSQDSERGTRIFRATYAQRECRFFVMLNPAGAVVGSGAEDLDRARKAALEEKLTEALHQYGVGEAPEPPDLSAVELLRSLHADGYQRASYTQIEPRPGQAWSSGSGWTSMSRSGLMPGPMWAPSRARYELEQVADQYRQAMSGLLIAGPPLYPIWAEQLRTSAKDLQTIRALSTFGGVDLSEAKLEELLSGLKQPSFKASIVVDLPRLPADRVELEARISAARALKEELTRGRPENKVRLVLRGTSIPDELREKLPDFWCADLNDFGEALKLGAKFFQRKPMDQVVYWPWPRGSHRFPGDDFLPVRYTDGGWPEVDPTLPAPWTLVRERSYGPDLKPLGIPAEVGPSTAPEALRYAALYLNDMVNGEPQTHIIEVHSADRRPTAGRASIILNSARHLAFDLSHHIETLTLCRVFVGTEQEVSQGYERLREKIHSAQEDDGETVPSSSAAPVTKSTRPRRGESWPDVVMQGAARDLLRAIQLGRAQVGSVSRALNLEDCETGNWLAVLPLLSEDARLVSLMGRKESARWILETLHDPDEFKAVLERYQQKQDLLIAAERDWTQGEGGTFRIHKSIYRNAAERGLSLLLKAAVEHFDLLAPTHHRRYSLVEWLSPYKPGYADRAGMKTTLGFLAERLAPGGLAFVTHTRDSKPHEPNRPETRKTVPLREEPVSPSHADPDVRELLETYQKLFGPENVSLTEIYAEGDDTRSYRATVYRPENADLIDPYELLWG